MKEAPLWAVTNGRPFFLIARFTVCYCTYIQILLSKYGALTLGGAAIFVYVCSKFITFHCFSLLSSVDCGLNVFWVDLYCHLHFLPPASLHCGFSVCFPNGWQAVSHPGVPVRWGTLHALRERRNIHGRHSMVSCYAFFHILGDVLKGNINFWLALTLTTMPFKERTYKR